MSIGLFKKMFNRKKSGSAEAFCNDVKGTEESSSSQVEHASYLYYLHSNGDPLPADAQELMNEFKEKILSKINSPTTNLVHTAKILGIERVPSHLDLGKWDDPVIALVRLQATSLSDWLKSTHRISIETDKSSSQYLVQLEFQPLRKACVQIEKEYRQSLVDVFKQLTSLLDINFVGNFEEDEDFIIGGEFTEIQIFSKFLDEHINRTKFDVEIECNTKGVFKNITNEGMFAKKLVANAKLGDTNGEKCEGRVVHDIAILLGAFAMQNSEVEKYAWKFKPYFSENSAEIEIYTKRGSSKQQPLVFLERIDVKCKQTLSTHQTLVLPIDAGTEYKKMLTGILKKIYNPELTVTFGKFHSVYMVFLNNIYEDVQQFVTGYEKVNKPMPCLASEITNAPVLAQSDPGKNEGQVNDPQTKEKIVFCGVFKRSNILEFYTQYRGKLAPNSSNVEISLNAEDYIQVRSRYETFIFNVLNNLEELHKMFLSSQIDDEPSNSPRQPVQKEKALCDVTRRNSMKKSQQQPIILEGESDVDQHFNSVTLSSSVQDQHHVVKDSVKDDISPPKLPEGDSSVMYMYDPTKTIISVSKQSIVDLEVQAIVNAANENLQHIGGIAQVIANAAGKSFIDECQNYVLTYGEIKIGECCITGSGNLQNKGIKKVIHSVGPVWKKSKAAECAKLISNCYYKSLLAAYTNGCISIAFPAISTGVYNAPTAEVTKIAVKVVMDFLKDNPTIHMDHIHFVDIQKGTVKKFIEALEGVEKLQRIA